MKTLDLTLPTPELNLAVDEALLQEAESHAAPTNLLRLWEAPEPLVVIGRASRIEDEVELSRCRDEGVPVLRRCSGGTAVVAGPGCLMYAVILSYTTHHGIQVVEHAHRLVMTRLRDALSQLGTNVHWQGTCDLTVEDRKISGNSLRCKRTHLLYHGTILYDFDLGLLDRYLRTPPRQPAYREDRTHGRFVANFPHSAASIRQAITAAWHAETQRQRWPEAETSRLVEQQYGLAEWNFRR